METATVSQQPTGCLSIALPCRVPLLWRDVADSLRGRFFPARTACALWAAREASLLGMAAGSWSGTMLLFLVSLVGFQADMVNVCLAY